LLQRLRKFVQLDTARRLYFLQALYLLGRMRYAIGSTPFKQLTAGLTVHRSTVESPDLDEKSLDSALAVGWAVRAAARFTPWQSSCLVQVLAAQRMLQAHAIPGVFYIGAVPGTGEAGREGLQAHAWLKCSGRFITGEAGHQRYTVVSAFSWP